MRETDRRTLPGRLSCLRNPALHGADHMAVTRQTEITKGLTGHVTDDSLGGEVCGRHGQQRLPPDGVEHLARLHRGPLHASLEGPSGQPDIFVERPSDPVSSRQADFWSRHGRTTRMP